SRKPSQPQRQVETRTKKIVQPHEHGNPDNQSDDEEAPREVTSSIDKADADPLTLDSISQKLPDNESEYICDNLPSRAQADVASPLVSKELIMTSILGVLDDTRESKECDELAHPLSDRTNLIFLKAVGCNCGALYSPKRKVEDT
ncbi:hypothetical protein Pmar_PMAR024996, partial [Perkinsus marinus ATCC 50983]